MKTTSKNQIYLLIFLVVILITFGELILYFHSTLKEQNSLLSTPEILKIKKKVSLKKILEKLTAPQKEATSTPSVNKEILQRLTSFSSTKATVSKEVLEDLTAPSRGE